MLQFTFYGHAAFGINWNGTKLLFDPFITPNEAAKDVNIDIIEADYILVSHGHSDHVADVEAIAKRTGATVVSNFEIVTWYQNKGIQNVHPMNTGGAWKFPFGTVKCVTAMHSSSLPDGSYGGNPMGFLIYDDNHCIYYSGDTALYTDMQLVPTYRKPDWAILSLGGNFTMDPIDASRAAKFVDCNKVIGVHFDTFGYIKINHEEAIAYFASHQQELILPHVGQQINL
jgi:L-ascorbate metabolism protein UlaG (beta-lactamase superfamily)